MPSARLLATAALASLPLLPLLPAFAEDYREPLRPQFHFTPKKNWINDPNGLVYQDGEYHLFYQYNPLGDKWGHMSWGHAVSSDLVHWQELPLALPEIGDIMAFSGSAVVDANNTSGFGKDGEPPLVAIYTGHNEKLKRQDQRLAYSADKGRTWTQYEGNPVLDIQAADFRDPKVFWDEASAAWIMSIAMATEKKIRFYSSPDLKTWTQTGEFGPAGSTEGLWECPDLFPLPVEGDAATRKWVLIVNVNPGGPVGGSGCQYFIGDFDGKTFTADAGAKPAEAQPTPAPAAKVFADFEGGYEPWTASGPAVGTAPARPAADAVRGMVGAGIVDTFGTGDPDQGSLLSPEFTIDTDTISFRIGGGNHPGEAGLNLLVDGQTVRTATGNNLPELVEKSWDVSDLKGKTARLEIFDRYSGTDWGHIFVDQIVLGGAPAKPASGTALWADYGSDFYAAITWDNLPKSDPRRILIGWMSNWDYANDVPTSPWRGAMTVPRTLTLRPTFAGIRLAQTPVKELDKLREGAPLEFAGGTFAEAAKWLDAQADLAEQLDIELEFSDVAPGSAFALSIQTGDGESTEVAVNGSDNTLAIDRAKSGATAFHGTFAARHAAPLEMADGRLSLRLLLDSSSLEAFAQAGTSVITDLIFPSPGARTLSLATAAGPAPRVDRITIHKLRSAWGAAPAAP